MRFQVKAGRPQDEILVVVVEISDPPKPPSTPSPKRTAMAVAVALAVVTVGSAAAYGVFTGDFSVLQGIAEVGKDVLAKVANAATKP